MAIYFTSTPTSSSVMDHNKTNSTEEVCGFSEMPARQFFIAVYTVICVVSLVLNSTAIYVYFCKVTTQSSITVYLKNMAIADLFACLCLILRIAKYASTSEEIQIVYCKIGAPASYLNMYSSILFMGYIAANRYMIIVRPRETNTFQTIRSARYICAITWVALLGFCSVYMAPLFFNFQKYSDNRGFDCDSFHNNLIKWIYLVMHILAFLTFLCVLVSLILCYWWNVQKLRQTQRTMPEQYSKNKLSKSKRIIRVLVVIFCVCFVPYHLLRLPYMLIKPLLHNCTRVQVFYILKELTVLFAVLNASLDPIIYVVFCKTFRKHLNLQQFCRYK